MSTAQTLFLSAALLHTVHTHMILWPASAALWMFKQIALHRWRSHCHQNNRCALIHIIFARCSEHLSHHGSFATHIPQRHWWFHSTGNRTLSHFIPTCHLQHLRTVCLVALSDRLLTHTLPNGRGAMTMTQWHTQRSPTSVKWGPGLTGKSVGAMAPQKRICLTGKACSFGKVQVQTVVDRV